MSKVDALQEVVSPAILRRAADISRLLVELNIPHVLIGGLAVGIHGHPRSTKDVDFMVGDYLLENAPELVSRLGEVLSSSR